MHNAGLAYPGLTRLDGSRRFTEPAQQTIGFAGAEDTRLVLFDATGNQVRSTSVRTLIGGAEATVSAVTAAIDGWLGGDGTAGLVDGALQIRITGAGLGLGIRDEAQAAAGSARTDATIAFDADADGHADETAAGFSAFFGLNDLFVDKAPTAAQDLRGDGRRLRRHRRHADLPQCRRRARQRRHRRRRRSRRRRREDRGSHRPSGPAGRGRRRPAPQPRLGGRLGVYRQPELGRRRPAAGRPRHRRGQTGLAGRIAVRADILAAPSLVSRGAVQWDPNRGAAGAYRTGIADDTAVHALADAFDQQLRFPVAGRLGAIETTLSGYATTLLGDTAAMTSSHEAQVAEREELVSSLESKSDGLRGVNLDEEMANLMVFEQAYAASARVFGVIKDMFDTLERMLG